MSADLIGIVLTSRDRLILDNRTLTAHNARLTAAITAIVTGGEQSEPRANEYGMLAREVYEKDYQACKALVDAPCGREAEDGE